MLTNILFYLCFLLQLWLISFFYARIVRERMQYVTTNFPPEQFPKLYVKPKESYLAGQQRFTLLNQVVLSIGLGVLIYLASREYSTGLAPFDVTAGLMFMLQMLPFALLEFAEYSYYKEMRKQHLGAIRTGSLTRRSIFQFVSANTVMFAAVLIALSIAVDVTALLSVDRSPIGKVINTIVTNAFLFLLVWRLVYGKKADPNLSNEDHVRQVQLTVQTLFYISISVSVFFILKQCVDSFTNGNFNPLLTSAYSVFIGYVAIGTRIRCTKVESLNFDGYKA